MPEADRNNVGRVFTIELSSGHDVRKVNVPNGTQGLLLEGTIGSLKHARFVDEVVLELLGTKGALRVDLSMEDLAKSSRYPRESRT